MIFTLPQKDNIYGQSLLIPFWNNPFLLATLRYQIITLACWIILRFCTNDFILPTYFFLHYLPPTCLLDPVILNCWFHSFFHPLYLVTTKTVCYTYVFNLAVQFTMEDGRLICPAQVHKIIPPPPWVSWVPRDQKLDVEYRSIGFMLILSVINVKSWKIGIFLVHFWDFSFFLKDNLFISIIWAKEWTQNLYTCVLHLILHWWTTMPIMGALV